MNTVKRWIDAIKNEDGINLSLGSLRTLNMIDDEYNDLLDKYNRSQAYIAELESSQWTGKAGEPHPIKGVNCDMMGNPIIP
jgi:hypothetical protein